MEQFVFVFQASVVWVLIGAVVSEYWLGNSGSLGVASRLTVWSGSAYFTKRLCCRRLRSRSRLPERGLTTWARMLASCFRRLPLRREIRRFWALLEMFFLKPTIRCLTAGGGPIGPTGVPAAAVVA